jgi:hypothetical protein
MRDLIGGNFLANRRDIALIGGTAPGRVIHDRKCPCPHSWRFRQSVFSMSSIGSPTLRPKDAPDVEGAWRGLRPIGDENRMTPAARPNLIDTCFKTGMSDGVSAGRGVYGG